MRRVSVVILAFLLSLNSFAQGESPVITVPPQGDTIFYNTAITLSVTATGTPPLHYQWYRVIGDDFIPVGENVPEYTSPLLTADATFSVVVSNDYGGYGSGRIEVKIGIPAHFPLWPPQPCCDETIYYGASTMLMAIGLGTDPLTFQWYAGESGDTSTPIGPNAPFFNTPGLITTTRIWVRVSNEFGQDDSETVTITVLPAPIELVTNGGFENGLTGWKVSKRANDKVVCDAIIAAEGSCAFVFKASGKLKTTILLDTPTVPGDTLFFKWQGKGMGINASMTIKVFAAASGEKIYTYRRLFGIGGYVTFLDSYAPEESANKIVMQVVNGATSGKLNIDGVSAKLQGPALRAPQPTQEGVDGWRH